MADYVYWHRNGFYGLPRQLQGVGRQPRLQCLLHRRFRTKEPVCRHRTIDPLMRHLEVVQLDNLKTRNTTVGERVAYVDTEQGTAFYGQAVAKRAIHPEAFHFSVMHSKSTTKILAAVKALDTNTYGVLVVDSITHLWDACRNAYAGKTTKAGTIPPRRLVGDQAAVQGPDAPAAGFAGACLDLRSAGYRLRRGRGAG